MQFGAVFRHPKAWRQCVGYYGDSILHDSKQVSHTNQSISLTFDCRYALSRHLNSKSPQILLPELYRRTSNIVIVDEFFVFSHADLLAHPCSFKTVSLKSVSGVHQWRKPGSTSGGGRRPSSGVRGFNPQDNFDINNSISWHLVKFFLCQTHFLYTFISWVQA